MKEPKLFIENKQELNELGKYWQDKLLLQNWIIKFEFLPVLQMSDPAWCGQSNVQWVNRCGTVSLLRKEDIPDDLLVKQPQELTLIHELLHFKFMGFEDCNKTIEGCYWDEKQHQLLEDMAKALYMTKYGLDYGWFKL